MQLILLPKKVASQTNSKLRTENSEKQRYVLNFLSYHDPSFLLNLPNAFSMFSSIPRGSRLELLGKARYKNIKWFKIGWKQLNSFYSDLNE